MITTIYFVRHAESNYDTHDDALRELTKKGMTDRMLVTHYLSDKHIDIVLSSPYKRAVDTITPFADSKGLEIKIVDAFRERKINSEWIDDFTAFSKTQWEDFSYKLSGGESLQEVQTRNITALKAVLLEYPGKNIAIGSHGTALSTIIHFYDHSFGYDDFCEMKHIMPWIVSLMFNEDGKCLEIKKLNLF